MAQLNTPMLTITIPTYNRPAPLLNTLSKLLPQLNEQCYLLIIDNKSDVPVVETTAELLSKYPDVNYKIVRNRVNIGGDSNIMRCFEYCETEWLWTLGDDDEITDNAIQTIFEDMIIYPDMVSINYNSPSGNRPKRNETQICHGREEFLNKIDSFGATFYISCNIYQTKYLTEYWLANNNTYSCISQWLILFYSLQSHSEVILSDKIICLNPVVLVGNESSNITVIQGIATLLDMRIPFDQKKLLIDCLGRDMYNLVSLESVFRTITMQYISTGNKNFLFIFKRLYHSYYKNFGFKIKLQFNVYYSFLSVAPQLAFKIIRNQYLRKRGIDLYDFISRDKLGFNS